MLKKYRLEHNLTQEQMAKQLGISISYYALLESGARQISLRVAKAMHQIGIEANIEEIVSTNSIIQKINKIRNDQNKMKKLRDFIDELLQTENKDV